MKYILIILIGLGAVALLYFFALPEPVVAPPEPESEQTEPETSYSHPLIRVNEPQPQQTVGNPITLSGEARGYWFFEASAPVLVTDWDGRIIGEGFITPTDDWMTEDFVPFSGTVSYELPVDAYSASGTIIFKKDNPSDLPAHDDAFEFPIILKRP